MVIPPGAHERIRALYEKGLLLSAWRAALSIGDPRSFTGTRDRILGGRLLAQVGAVRAGQTQHLKAWREDPLDVEAAEYAARVVLARRGPWFAWRFLSTLGELRPAEPQQLAGLAAERATAAGALRDFTLADRHMAEAFALAPDYAWLHVQQAWLYEMEDRIEDALASAQACVERTPASPAGLCSVARYHRLLGRDREAVAALTGPVESLESAYVAFQLASIQIELGDYGDAERNLRRAAELWPVADPPLRDGVIALQADAAYLSGDRARAIELAGRIEGEGQKAVREKMEAAEPDAKRVLLDVPFIRQRHVSCAATTLTSIARFWGRPVDHESVIEEIVYDGSRPVEERRWAEQHGWTVREFTVTATGLVALLDRGIPFGLVTSDPSRSHMQPVVGYDTVRGTILIRDPGSPELLEWVMDSALEQYAPIGPRGMAFVPEDQSHLFDGLELQDETLSDLLYRVRSSLLSHDRDAAVAARREMATLAPDHRLVEDAQLEILSYDRDGEGVLAVAERLLSRYPESELLAHFRLRALDGLGRRSEHFELLRELANRENAHPASLESFADLLCERDPEAARVLVLKAIRRLPDGANGYAILSRVLWFKGQRTLSHEATRFATCLNDRDESLAAGWFAAARHGNRTEEALAELRQRYERFKERSFAPAFALFRALEGLDRVPEALAVLEEARAYRPEDGGLILVTAQAYCRFGRIDEGGELLEQSRQLLRPLDRLRVLAEIRTQRGDLRGALALWQEIVQKEPLDIGAQEECVGLLLQLDGRAAAVDHLSRMLERFPRHQGLAEGRASVLRSAGPDERKAALKTFLEVHPENPWALRELATVHVENSAPQESFALLERAEAAAPLSPALLNIRGRTHQTVGNREAAVRDFRRSMKLQIDNNFAIRNLVALARDQEEARDALGFVRSELQRQYSEEEGIAAWKSAAQHILEPEAIVGTLELILEERPWHAPGWYVLTLQLMEADLLEQAWERVSEATERFPLNARFWALRGEVALRSADESNAIVALERAIAVSPNWSHPRRILADAYDRLGDSEAAREVIEGAIARSPADAMNFGYLADWQQRAEQIEAAVESLTRAIALDPEYAWAWQRLDELATRQGQPDLVENKARELTELRGGKAANQVRLARFMAGANRGEERLAVLDRALELDPRLVEAHLLRADLLAGEGRFTDARRACRPEVIGDDVPIELRGREIAVLADEGKPGAAAKQMAALLEQNGSHLPGWIQLFGWAGEIDDRELMRRAASKLVELAPGSAEAHKRMAELLEHCNEQEEALRSFARASRLAPEDTYVGYRAFSLALHLGKLDAARETLDRMQPWLTTVGMGAFEVMFAAGSGAKRGALSGFRELVASPNATRNLLDLAVESLSRKNWINGAMQSLKGQLDRGECSPEAVAVIVGWYREQRRWGDARRLADRLADHPLLFEVAAMEFMSAIDSRVWRREVDDFIHDHAKRLRSNDALWGQTAHALRNIGAPRRVLRWMDDWESRSAEPWMLLNLALALRSLRRDEHAAEVSRAAAALPGDHATASHEAWLAYDAATRDDYEAARDHLSRAPEEEVDALSAAALLLATTLVSFEEAAPQKRKVRSRQVRRKLNTIVNDRKQFGEKLVLRLWRESAAAAYRLCPSLSMWIYRIKAYL